ncbi:MAG: plasmid pRiA4b ORF-3 family protein [Pseudomonadota bacterium]
MSKKIYQFKISLKGIRPPIWRRIQVPEDYDFYELHVAIQDAMGWYDSHLHQYEIMNPKTGEREIIGMPDDEYDDVEIKDEKTTKIARYFKIIKKANYEYDFGDAWEHEIVLEKVIPAQDGETYPKCVAGKRACPPEDCGGVWGYEELLDIMQDPKHPEHKERKEWLGGEFESEKFDAAEVSFENPKKRLKELLEYS